MKPKSTALPSAQEMERLLEELSNETGMIQSSLTALKLHRWSSVGITPLFSVPFSAIIGLRNLAESSLTSLKAFRALFEALRLFTQQNSYPASTSGTSRKP